MYTYLIIALISIVIFGCLLKLSTKNKPTIYILSIVVFIILSTIIITIINRSHVKKLQKITYIYEFEKLKPILYKIDSNYIQIKRELNSLTYIIDSVKQPNKKYDTIQLKYHYTYAESLNDSTIYVIQDKDTILINPNTKISVSYCNAMVTYKDKYIGDNWTSGIALNSFNQVSILQLTPASVDYLYSKHPKIRSIWKIN